MADAGSLAAAGSIPTLRASSVLAAALAARAEIPMVHPAMTAKDSTSQASRVKAAPARVPVAAKEEGKPLSTVYFLLSTNYVQQR